MTDERDDRSYFFSRRTDKTIVSKSFPGGSGRKLRIASHIVDGQGGLQFALLQDEVVLRKTRSGRYEIKATFLEDDRKITTLTIQKYSTMGPLAREHFSFVGSEIDTLLDFIVGIKSVQLGDASKLHITDEMLRDIVLNRSQAQRLFSKNEPLFLEIAQREDLTRDLIAVGYRRKQLERFEELLRDAKYFSKEQDRLAARRPEDVWQQFFEVNTWIFGYGLSYQFVSGLDGRKLEQIIRGGDVVRGGKRADVLMKTRGLISSLCFVEIKRHDTPLLTVQQYRSEASELAGGVAQVQATVQTALETFGRTLSTVTEDGDPTGEFLFNIEPRSCLVIGSLAQFRGEHGINEGKFRSFELYRRNTWRPEILTFDELLERAKFIVLHGEQAVAAGA
jgi:Domain of unknown function (DUF4263)